MTVRDYYRQERVVAQSGWSPVAPGGTIVEAEYVVTGYSILSTDTVVFEVYEEEAGHSTSFRSDEFGRLGAVLSRPLPAEIAALPYGDERTARCLAEYEARRELCHEVIRAAFPEIAEAGVLVTRDGRGSCRLAYALGLAAVRP